MLKERLIREGWVRLLTSALFVILGGLFPSSGHATIEIRWWHAMDGQLGAKVESLAADFNRSQNGYRVIPVYKGDYTQTMTAGIAAFRTKQPPHILQVFDVGTATMMVNEHAFRLLPEVMEEVDGYFDSHQFIPTVSSYYTNQAGQMVSMPFNSSTPVLYYNKTAFKKAGLDGNSPPKTWLQVADYAKKLLAAGYPCGFSTSWISWIHLENLTAWHNVPFATGENGFDGLDVRLTLNDGLPVKHFTQLAAWEENRIFSYGGRKNLGNSKFFDESCPMYTASSASYAEFKAKAPFDFGMSELPYWADMVGAPQNTMIGGASLWVMNGHSKVEYRGVAQFFKYLISPTVQADWHQSTGYLPITRAAYEITKKSDFYKQHPDMEVALKQLTRLEPTPNSRGVRLGHMVRLRDIILHELESILAGRKSAKQGLGSIVNEGDELLQTFRKSYQAKLNKP
ncbi:MAG: sn-glycerol-3-phosphate ABC transporter substrate-binding protein UgpB [Magnetococcales bacterium]|nr:sn-glycerol-3-phosphate ABC transporter substrate-binding protein UgpB [Magnetococcales bacterium]